MTFNMRLVPGLAFGVYLMSGMDYEEEGAEEYNTQILIVHFACLCFDFMWNRK